MEGRPTLTLALPNFGSYFKASDWRWLVDVATCADDAHIDRLSVADHVVMGASSESYAWGKFPLPPTAPWLEPMVVLSAIAAATVNIRLSTSILIAPLRGATLLAKTAATLDVLSNGRLDLGVGVGWQPAEYTAAGLDFSQRGRRLDDTIEACLALWRDSPASFRSETVSFDEIYCSPAPVQPGGPRLWLGGTMSERTLRRLRIWASGWIPIPINGDSLESLCSTVREGIAALDDGTRSDTTRSLEVSVTLPLVRDATGRFGLTESLSAVPTLVDAGVTNVSVPLHAFCRTPEAAPQFVVELRKRFTDAIG